jgi:TolA-binding protein
MRITLIVFNCLLFLLFGWGTYQQIVNQRASNQVMAEVYQEIRQAGALTHVTNQQLRPLAQTADTIDKMNQKLKNTRDRLTSMNQNLHNVTVSEQKIVEGLDKLNGHTSTVLGQLDALSTQNGQLIPSSSALEGQSGSENNLMSDLSKLTDISIRELQTLNRKLVWLSYLP